jgi:hypothetical protein
MTLHSAHRISALMVGLFVTLHVLNHLALVAGTDLHIQIMKDLRAVYRLPLVEASLFAAIGFQIYSGLRFLLIRIKQPKKDHWLWLQILSGAYLAYFFINHIGATLFARIALGLDTNIYFATVGFYVPPFQFFFYPYYFLSVSAFFAHIAGVAHSMQLRKPDAAQYSWLPMLLVFLGTMLGAVVVAAQGGVFHEIRIPGEYLAAFENVIH